MSLSALLLITATFAADPVPFYEDKLDLSYYNEAEGTKRAITSPADWRVRRGHLLENMQLVMGYLPPERARVPLDIQIESETDTPKYTLKKLTYAVEPGDRVPAYLFVPKDINGKAPAMLCLHQTNNFGGAEPAGLEGLPNLHYAKELAERGYVCLAPDYPRFGRYSIDVYRIGYVSATMKGIWNHMGGVDLLQSLPEVDGERIGCIGHSLGGHNTLFVSAFDERIKVAVTSCGFTRFAKYYNGDLTGWTHKGYMPRIDAVYDKDPARMPFDFPDILASLAPRNVFINAPTRDANFDVDGVRESVDAAKKIFAVYKSEDHIVAVHPDCEHDFPSEIRGQAYKFVDSVLKP